MVGLFVFWLPRADVFRTLLPGSILQVQAVDAVVEPFPSLLTTVPRRRASPTMRRGVRKFLGIS